MKKLIILLILATVFTVSCGGSKKTENNDTDLMPDEDTTDADENQEYEEKEEEEESSVPDKDIPIEEAVCKPNPCKKMEHSNGKCEFDGDRSYICHCEEGYHWEDYKCVSPCDDNPCDNVKNSDGCYTKNRETFACRCKEGYAWDGESCLNPCESHTCPAHSECHAYNATSYGCICDDNFFKENDECVSPCDPNPCKGVANSTGKCIAANSSRYSCECKNNYVFTYKNECVSPCEPNPCTGLENVSGTCYTIDANNYSCGCKKGFYWLGENGGCQPILECSPENNGFCKDSESQLIWSSRAERTDYPGAAQLFRIFERAEAYCNNLKEGGFADWHLPTIDELRTLIVNCPKLEPYGTCRVSDKTGCLASTCYKESQCLCEGDGSEVIFSKFGSEGYGQYWSSSAGGFNGYKQYWLIQTEGSANVFSYDLYEYLNEYFYAPARCVRK
ncbi:DUF1566 domain-containing protein [bacterium]|nr:DUF1566 domain-containing protein [bacterium]